MIFFPKFDTEISELFKKSTLQLDEIRMILMVIGDNDYSNNQEALTSIDYS